MLPHTVSPTVKLTRACLTFDPSERILPRGLGWRNECVFRDLDELCEGLICNSRGTVRMNWGIIDSSSLDAGIEVT